MEYFSNIFSPTNSYQKSGSNMASGSIHLRSESYKENFDPEQDSVVQETQAQTSKMLTIPGIPGHSKFVSLRIYRVFEKIDTELESVLYMLL